MALRTQNKDFEEIWNSLKVTVSDVLALKEVERSVWNKHSSDICELFKGKDSHLKKKLYDETRLILEDYVENIVQHVRGPDPLESGEHVDPYDGLLTRYYDAWNKFKKGVEQLTTLYSDSIIPCYESKRTLILAMLVWKIYLIQPLAPCLSKRILLALIESRNNNLKEPISKILGDIISSTVEVQGSVEKKALFNEMVWKPYEKAATLHLTKISNDLIEAGDFQEYLQIITQELERESVLEKRFFAQAHTYSLSNYERYCYKKVALEPHLPQIYANAAKLISLASELTPQLHTYRRNIYQVFKLLKSLGPDSLGPLVQSTYDFIIAHGIGVLTSIETKDKPHIYFVNSILKLHARFYVFIVNAFCGSPSFLAALERACNELVNYKINENTLHTAPELLVRYCDYMLRLKNCKNLEQEIDSKLASSIVVLKYIDDKDIFLKLYARSLSCRLLYELYNNIDHEEAMISHLKSVCGYEFTYKLHRMFTDINISTDLNNKFQQYLRDSRKVIGVGFTVKVLQAGTWPLSMSPIAPSAAMERPIRLFEDFYRSSFNGRRLTWLHRLCTAELKTTYTRRAHYMQVTLSQYAILKCFENKDVVPAKEIRVAHEIPMTLWTGHIKPLIDIGLLKSDGDVADETGEVNISINLQFQNKRAHVKVLPNTHTGMGASLDGCDTFTAPSGPSISDHGVSCEEDRKMCLRAAIVRIMKQSKTLKHEDLIKRMLEKPYILFTPSENMIQISIQSLIDEKYLKRIADDTDTYSYLV